MIHQGQAGHGQEVLPLSGTTAFSLRGMSDSPHDFNKRHFSRHDKRLRDGDQDCLASQ